ncbi:MAG TPA: substrate-binding domain-containing protein, partial [Armatimonadota bacterium]|nr:substrate-binding domain-containing protein [Armatimonadota bacterium]
PEVIGGHYLQLRVGFEEQIAQLGGTSLVLTRDRASYCREHGQLPPLAGIFAFSEFLNQELLIWGKEDRIPLVNFDGCVEDPIHADRVSFDDTDGGRQATQHLISLGYRQIAFVALHRSNDIASLPWSTEREAGWREALAEIGQPTDGLIFHPETLISHTYDRNTTVLEYARQLANTLLLRTDITAVITANDDLALYLIEMFKEIGLPTTQWPALIGFDNSPRAASEFQLSSLRLPWEDLGREAAMLLWQRSHGKVNGAPQHHRVHMSLIARFTSHRNWSLLSHSTTSPRS